MNNPYYIIRIDIERDTMTREEFAELTKNAYGGETIRKLIAAFDPL